MSPPVSSKTATNLAWQNMHNRKLLQTKDFLLKPAKDNTNTQGTVTVLCDDSIVHFTSKVLATKSVQLRLFHVYWHNFCADFFYNFAGVQDFITVSDTNDKQDFTCALSLLSINPWDSYATKSMSLEHSSRSTSVVQAVTHAMSQRMPLA